MWQKTGISIEKSKQSSTQCLAIQKPTNLYLQITLTLGLFTLLCFAQLTHAESPTRIVKWKDENGMTHYGDKIPPQYANRENTVINKQGVTVERNKPTNSQTQALDLEKLEQNKKDKVLLGAYTNANEIDLARDRNLQPDLITLENLQQDKANGQKKLNKINSLADSYTKSKKPVPADVDTDIKINKAAIAKIDQQIGERQKAIENTRKRFDEDKKRYLLLKGQGNNTPTEAPGAVNSVKPASVSAGPTN